MCFLMSLQVVITRKILRTAFHSTVIHSRSIMDTIDMPIEIFRGSTSYITLWPCAFFGLVVISHVAAR
jgi:pyrimidine deaminase RibD-like protein